MPNMRPPHALSAGRDARLRATRGFHHGLLVWKVRFRGDRWLYLMLLLEFQTTVERTMAVRMLAYTALLYQRLIAEGGLSEDGALPPVLPVVVYNGRRPWTAASDVSELAASADPVLARYQPSQRQVLLPRRFRGTPPESLPRLEEVRTMLEETVREWTADWVAEGREQGLEQGLEQGRAEERALLCRQAARKFDDAAGRRLAAALAEVADAERLAEVGDWIIECGTAAELLASIARSGP